jgi:glycosyltransferase involved in cell wall biosynthesis
MVVGHPYGILGLGENLRSTASALGSAGVPFHICNALGAQSENAKLLTDFAYHRLIDDTGLRYKANLFCMNADEMDNTFAHLGTDVFLRSYNIGCWWWELSEFPDKWVRSFEYLHEIWAQSRFVQESISRKSPIPVIWMPQAIEPGPANPALARSLGVPKDRFSFLFVFDFASYVARKNPLAVIEAFRRAFGDATNQRVCLVIKMNGMRQAPREFKEFVDKIDPSDKSVILIDKVLSDSEMKGLFSGCDAFVSLHRSEGFGRGLAEAMYYGKPVIATGYSGNLDFMNPLNSCLVDYTLVPVLKGEYPFWKGQMWADPDIDHAAKWMRRLYEDRDLCRRIGISAQESIRSAHGAHAVGLRMASRLNQLGHT